MIFGDTYYWLEDGQGYPRRILHSKETLNTSRVPVWTVTLTVLLSLPFQKAMLVDVFFVEVYVCSSQVFGSKFGRSQLLGNGDWRPRLGPCERRAETCEDLHGGTRRCQ